MSPSHRQICQCPAPKVGRGAVYPLFLPILVLLLAACSAPTDLSPSLPDAAGAAPTSPPLAAAETRRPTATLAPTLTVAPTGTATPPPTATATPLPTATPTPTLPPMRVFTDETGVIRVRVPEAWQASVEQGPALMQATFARPDGSNALFVLVLPVLEGDTRTLDDLIPLFLGDLEETSEPERLPDGTLRLTGLTSSLGFVEMRLQRRAGFNVALIATPQLLDAAESERLFKELFDSFHLYPTRAATLFNRPAPTLDPAALEVTSIEQFTSATGALWVIGEVANRGEVDVELVEVSVRLLSASGETVAQESGFVESDLLLAGERAPFSVIFEQPPAPEQWVTTQPALRASLADRLIEQSAPGLRVTSSAVAEPFDPATYRLTGTLQNEGDVAREQRTRHRGALRRRGAAHRNRLDLRHRHPRAARRRALRVGVLQLRGRCRRGRRLPTLGDGDRCSGSIRIGLTQLSVVGRRSSVVVPSA